MSKIVSDGQGQQFVLRTQGGSRSSSSHSPFGGQSLRGALGRAASIRGVADDPGNRQALTEALVEIGAISPGRAVSLSQEEVRVMAEVALSSGAITLVPHERSLRPVCDIEKIAPAEELADGLVEEEVHATHTLELELVDEDDEPVANEPYRVELPGGDIVNGRLNAQGRALLTGIRDSGNCKVTFPRLDESVWAPG
ncbi:MAG: hypothetical protein AB1Z98_33435 [Nannocystaceae bacterium]